jgi:hypothetical protein
MMLVSCDQEGLKPYCLWNDLNSFLPQTVLRPYSYLYHNEKLSLHILWPLCQELLIVLALIFHLNPSLVIAFVNEYRGCLRYAPRFGNTSALPLAYILGHFINQSQNQNH